jgi:hypothetical protein
MQLAPDWNRDAITRGNFSTGGEILKSRRDSPQNTRVVGCLPVKTAVKLLQKIPEYTHSVWIDIVSAAPTRSQREELPTCVKTEMHGLSG